ncbi:MAG TPA: FAD-dependent monooxygenase, partial [Pseudolabrys sp.]|nr:FAD-dependent monooxygenase [Pseudolabrys sp.]
MKDAQEISVIVVGAGPAGLTAAVTLAEANVPTVLIGKRPMRPDNRTTALLASSVTALRTLGAWDVCAQHAAPLRVMRIVDDTGRLWRAPEVKFDAAEIGLDAFGHNIENRHLVTALEQKARTLPSLRMVDGEAAAFEFGAHDVTVRLKDGASLKAPLIIGADGRKSHVHDAAGITIKERHYPQSALTVCLAHSRPHRDTSTEFHSSSGPFTLVPLP